MIPMNRIERKMIYTETYTERDSSPSGFSSYGAIEGHRVGTDSLSLSHRSSGTGLIVISFHHKLLLVLGARLREVPALEILLKDIHIRSKPPIEAGKLTRKHFVAL